MERDRPDEALQLDGADRLEDDVVAGCVVDHLDGLSRMGRVGHGTHPPHSAHRTLGEIAALLD
jgi:hypothetical protein